MLLCGGHGQKYIRHRLLCADEHRQQARGLPGGAADQLGLIKTPQEADQLAETVEDAGGVSFVPAFTGLGAPYWDMYARGALLGVTRGTTRAHLCRAVLESIALESADLVEAMKRESGVAIPELRADGGASRSRFLMQYQADILNTRVCRGRAPGSSRTIPRKSGRRT